MTRLLLALATAALLPAAPKPFVHPGIAQTRQDLEFMKAKVRAGEQPWKQAWDNLLKQPISSLDFQPHAVVHIARGAFGRSANGDRNLMNSALAAYSQALQWYVTRDPAHARKAIEIVDAWSGTLWDFEGNDAKLLAGWTGGTFSNAAEILRSSDAGWSPQSMTQFKRMLLTVYYPLLKDFFPEANGNWDAAIMQSLMAIGIFCDDHAIFDRAVEHFLHGAGNGGIAKYIYPSGQCAENTRDMGHTQLGLGYFAKDAEVAWNQGVDLWSAYDNRLALGFEYTAKYLLGEDVPAYGTLSSNGRGRISDIYEPVYQHYHVVEGMEMPYTARALARTRDGGWALLTANKGGVEPAKSRQAPSPQGQIVAGALDAPTAKPPVGAIHVAPGESIQSALDSAAAGAGWVVLEKGLHTIKASLRMPGGVTLSGQGHATVLYFDPNVPAGNTAITMVNAGNDLHDVTLRDFLIEGSILPKPPTDPNSDHRTRSYQNAPSREGIAFAAEHPGEMRNLRFEHLTVRNCTHNGVAIHGASQVKVVACDFTGNGSSGVPGPGLEHNLLLTRVIGAEVRDSRMDDSPWGSGIAVSLSRDVALSHNETARNARDGIEVADSENIRVEGNLVEANGAGTIVFNTWMGGSKETLARNNVSR